jgi:hypothetical protein
MWKIFLQGCILSTAGDDGLTPWTSDSAMASEGGNAFSSHYLTHNNLWRLFCFIKWKQLLSIKSGEFGSIFFMKNLLYRLKSYFPDQNLMKFRQKKNWVESIKWQALCVSLEFISHFIFLDEKSLKGDTIFWKGNIHLQILAVF